MFGFYYLLGIRTMSRGLGLPFPRRENKIHRTHIFRIGISGLCSRNNGLRRNLVRIWSVL
jgi:hypothetical protein